MGLKNASFGIKSVGSIVGATKNATTDQFNTWLRCPVATLLHPVCFRSPSHSLHYRSFKLISVVW